MNKNNSSRGRQAGKNSTPQGKNQFKKPNSSQKKEENSSSRINKQSDKSSSFQRENRFKKDFKKTKPATSSSPKNEDSGVRLNKYIANSGICSRREADTYIEHGSVTINGNLVTEMGYKVQPTDEVRFDGSVISMEKKRYLLLNKPKNYITTMDDDRGRKTVMELIANSTKERVYPVGRLDRNTTGLLLFTNDGELAKKLTHPKHNIKKLYHASLDKKLTINDLDKLRGEVIIEGRKVFIDAVSYVEGEKKTEVGIEIHSGRNRIVRKIFEHLGYDVIKLDRVVFAGLTKKNLPRGRWRELTEIEINNLKMS